MKFISVGFGNMVADERILAIVSPDSAPIKRLMQEAKDQGKVIDVSCGRKTRSVIITDSDLLVFSSLQPETISARVGSDEQDDAEGQDD